MYINPLNTAPQERNDEKDGKLFDHLREVADMMPTDNSPPAGS